MLPYQHSSWIAVMLSGLLFCHKVSGFSLRKPQLPTDALNSDRQNMLTQDQQFWSEMAFGTELELHRLARLIGFEHKLGSNLAVIQLADSVGTYSVGAPLGASAELEPMAEMLDSLYEESKKRIVKINQQESQSKQRFLDHQNSDKKRMAEIEGEFKSRHGQHMTAALQANDTALKNHLEDEENFFMKYWGRVRERNHKQYHTFLKIQHGLMDRLKSMREAYQNTATPQVTQSADSAQPEVAAAALIQHQSFVQEALEEVKSLHDELSSWD